MKLYLIPYTKSHWETKLTPEQIADAISNHSVPIKPFSNLSRAQLNHKTVSNEKFELFYPINRYSWQWDYILVIAGKILQSNKPNTLVEASFRLDLFHCVSLVLFMGLFVLSTLATLSEWQSKKLLASGLFLLLWLVQIIQYSRAVQKQKQFLSSILRVNDWKTWPNY